MLDIYRQCCFNRFFEYKIAEGIKSGLVTCPTYLSVGSEFIPVLLKNSLEKFQIPKTNIFGQHRSHSYHNTFVNKPLELALELCGSSKGCNKGYGGSASISGENHKYKLFAHDGLLASQVPIGTGYAFASNEFTVIIMGDGACEEDWVFQCLSFVQQKECPVLFIVENNNLSITTPINERRNWSILDVSKTFGVIARKAFKDLRLELYNLKKDLEFVRSGFPRLIEYNIERHYWHVGSGKDEPPKYDYLENFENELLKTYKLIDLANIEQEEKSKILDIWDQLETQLKN